MSTPNTFAKTTPKPPGRFRLPDIPEKHPDDMTSFKQLAENGNAARMKAYLGRGETTIVSGERYVCAEPGAPRRYPDLLVAFDAAPDLYEADNGYVVSEQGKAPDLVLEIASGHTWRTDVEVKPEFYAGLGILEYWRFDETGEHHGTKLAGDRLVEGRYEPIEIEELPGGELRGYSEVLELYLCWREGWLDWYDPAAEDYIPSQESEREGRLAAEAQVEVERVRADVEREARLQEQQRRQQEQARADDAENARLAAEARVRDLEERYGERPLSE